MIQPGLAHYSADTREQLLTPADQVHHKLNHLEEKLHRVDRVQRAQLHLEQIFSWWSAGRYASFSPAGRCYVALEELRWGAFGDVIRQSETGRVNQLLDILRHKALTQMAQESGGSATVRLNTLDWLGGRGREQADNEWHDAINWLGDWCSEEQHPVIWSTTQAAEHLPVRMPRLCSAERPLKVWSMKYFRRGCMSTEMKTGLVLSGGGAVGAYQAGVVKALAECGTQISMVSGASIGAFNGAIIAASPDLSEAAVRPGRRSGIIWGIIRCCR